MPGKIIVLNGTSSSGKSSIAEALKDVLTDYYHHLTLDDLMHGAPASFRGDSESADSDTVGYIAEFSEDKKSLVDYSVTAKGYLLMRCVHAAIAGFCRENINVIYDTVIFDEEMQRIAAQEFAMHEVFFVGVRCSEEVRKKRELDRGDRGIGTYNLKADFIYNKCQYDIEIDTTLKTGIESATELAKILDSVSPTVFQNILTENQPN